MNTPATKLPADVFDTLRPGWTPDAWVAFTNSPANLSANRILSAAEQLRDAIERHLAEYPAPTVEQAADWPRPGSHAPLARHHMAGVLYVVSEFCDAVADFVPEPEPEQATHAEGRAAA